MGKDKIIDKEIVDARLHNRKGLKSSKEEIAGIPKEFFLNGRFQLINAMNPRTIDKKAKEDFHIFVLDILTGEVICKKFLEGKEIKQ